MNNTQKRIRKATMLRQIRSEGINNRVAKHVALTECGTPSKETLGDYWPIQQTVEDSLFCCKSDGESWTCKWLLPGQWDDEEIAYVFNIVEHYGGPGRAFNRAPFVERSERSTLVTQLGGLDI